jgi:murein DD-endopeptidase MepM/ murein hydrolase activator NlpD
MKYHLPISCPVGFKPTITQRYGDTAMVAWYQAHGLNLTSHNGIDIVIGDSIQTYGTKLVCPVPNAQLSMTWFTDPMSTAGNGIQIGWDDGADRYNLIFWHCSEIVSQETYKEGDIVGYIGNSGLVKPPPTPQQPFNGSHLHLGLRKNNVLIDPLTIFDKDEWFISEDTTQAKDLPPLFWALEYAKSQLKKLTDSVAKFLSK